MIKTKAFTLIELLVVVAIIGILSAIGVVAYNGYTSAAKKAAVKSNHNSIVKYISNEVMKCELGVTNIMNNLQCTFQSNPRDWKRYMGQTMQGMTNWKNPYDTKNTSIRHWTQSTAATQDYMVGYNYFLVTNQSSKTPIQIKSCFATPCSQSDNRIETNVEIF